MSLADADILFGKLALGRGYLTRADALELAGQMGGARRTGRVETLAGAAVRLGYAVGHPEVISSIDKTLFPFAVNGVAQAAAIAAIGAIDEIRQRVGVILDERERVAGVLGAAGWRMPRSEANFVYLPLGDRTEEVNLALERRGVVVRPFPGEGIRVTIGSAAENDRFLTALADVAIPD